MTKPKPQLLVSPFVVVIDSREQLPYAFASIRADAVQDRAKLLVRSLVSCLPAGDYSIQGHEKSIAVERKSLADLFGTIGQERDRFERELARLAEYPYAAVVIEAGWNDILFAPPDFSRLSPKTVFRSILAWQQRYPRVHWWPMPSRVIAEVTTYRILERWWKNASKKGLNPECQTSPTSAVAAPVQSAEVRKIAGETTAACTSAGT